MTRPSRSIERESSYAPATLGAISEITFIVVRCAETGGFVARWDAPGGGGIATQADSFADLDSMISDAVSGYFEEVARPRTVQLHFTEDPVIPVA